MHRLTFELFLGSFFLPWRRCLTNQDFTLFGALCGYDFLTIFLQSALFLPLLPLPASKFIITHPHLFPTLCSLFAAASASSGAPDSASTSTSACACASDSASASASAADALVHGDHQVGLSVAEAVLLLLLCVASASASA